MVAEKQTEEARYQIRYPQVADYGRMNAQRINALGDFIEEIKEECDADRWFDEAIKRAKPKRNVAHDRFSYDADAALYRMQRDEARQLFSQFIPVEHVEGIGRGFELPPATPTIRIRDHEAEEGRANGGDKPIYTRGQVDWFAAAEDPEMRDELLREGVKHMMGYMAWIRDFDEAEKAVKELRALARRVGLLE